uniref:Reverse transcriptase zinc-binding domain-containing protein n=1 Tax=Rhodnius prolixus TaxID=13249 RepID=T1HEH2_RHOPR
MTLCNSMVESTVLYSAEVWAPLYCHKLEVVPLRFYKSLYHWPRNTPNHFVRLESGHNNIEIKIVKRMVTWLCRVMEMDSSRLPKICIQRLKALDKWSGNKIHYNWYTQLKEKLSKVGMIHIINYENPDIIRKELPNLVEKYVNHHVSKDVESVLNSNYNKMYRCISALGFKESYLQIHCNLSKRRILSQLRISNENRFKLFFKGNLYTLETGENCTICNLQKPENLIHFLLNCPIYSSCRKKYLTKYIDRSLDELAHK